MIISASAISTFSISASTIMQVSSVPVQLPSVPVTVHSKYRSEYEILTSTVGQLKSQMSDVKKVKSQR